MAAPTAMAIYNDFGDLVLANRAFQELGGYPDLPGLSLAELLRPAGDGAVDRPIEEPLPDASAREVVRRLICADGSSRLVGAIFSNLEPAQNRTLRCLTLRPVRQEADGSRRLEAAPPADGLISFARRGGDFSICRLSVQPLSKPPEGEPPASPARTVTLRQQVEAAIARFLSPNDLCLRSPGFGYLLCFRSKMDDPAVRGAELVRSLRREFQRGPAQPRVLFSATTGAFGCKAADGLTEQALIDAVERRLQEECESRVRTAKMEFSAACDAAVFQADWLSDPSGLPMPIAFVALDAPSERRMIIALATIPDPEPQMMMLDRLFLKLAVDAAASDIVQSVNRVYLVPVEYDVFRSRVRLAGLMRACRDIPDGVRSRLIFMLRYIPAGLPRLRRQTALDHLARYAKGAGIDLLDVEPDTLDVGKRRVPLIACRSDALVAAWRRQDTRLSMLLERRRRHSARLIATGVSRNEHREVLTELSLDMLSYVSETRVAAKPGPGSPPTVTSAIAFEEAATSLFVVDASKADRPVVLVNHAFSALTGYSPEEIVGKSWLSLLGMETQPAILAEIDTAMEQGRTIQRDLLTYRRDGSSFWTGISLHPVAGGDGRGSYVGSQIDISSRRMSAAQYLALEGFYRTVADSIPGFIFQRLVVNDNDFFYPYVSTSFARLVGLPSTAKVASDTVIRHFHPDDVRRLKDEFVTANTLRRDHTVEFRLLRTDGEVIWVRAQASPSTTKHGRVMWTGVAVDISLEKSVERNLSHLHHHDTLTGLLNRSAFRKILCDRVLVAQLQHTDCAVIDIDLVSFDEINDAFGRPVGDRILQEIALRLLKLSGTEGVAARLGGDSFGLILSGIEDRGGVSGETSALIQDLARPFVIDGQHLKIQSVAGAAVYLRDSEHTAANAEDAAEELIKRAGVARHEARLSHGNMYAIYTPEIDSRIRKRARLRQSLHRAIDAEEFELYYQPIVQLETGVIRGAEALLRWNEPKLGRQRPDQFIPLAEESGLIVPLGAWALRSAVRELRRWDGPDVVKPRIAVNVSGVQLQERDFVASVEKTLVEGEIDPGQIELELTESFLIHESGRLGETLRELKGLGTSITIDDFGTGYSSFQYLRELPATKVKIDQSFIRNLEVESSDASIVRAMIAMAANLGLDVVVEGVETAEQREFLVREGCGLAQGYYFSVPLQADEFFRLFQAGTILPTIPPPGVPPSVISRSPHGAAVMLDGN